MDNIRVNSAGRKGWQKLEEAHERIAILCGSGPSLADTLGEIQAIDGDVFALNGAGKFLFGKGITPEYQVILDAQRETADLIGPAKQYLFASQVDPECFKRIPSAKLWHATHGEIAPEFPEYEDDYCMVGGAVTVGNAALLLAYVMGYRTIHCFGYDSSHRGAAGHAFKQSMNDGDPLTIVEFNGKEYTASLTMRLQAQYFPSRARALMDAGCKISVHGSGLLPDMFNTKLSEKEKYRAMWKEDQYRIVSPGESVANTFVEVCGIDAGHMVIDFGCGTGRGGQRVRDMTGARMRLVDFAENCLDRDVDLPLTICDLTKPMGLRAEYGFCADVMEHIPPQDVRSVLENIFACTPKAFFQISLEPDSMGSLIGRQLHLSVFPYAWWADQFRSFGKILWSENRGASALFYVEKT